MAFLFRAPCPWNDATLSNLRTKHPFVDPHEIREALEKMAEIPWQPHPPEEIRITEVETSFDAEDIGTMIKHTCPQSGPGPSGLR